MNVQTPGSDEVGPVLQVGLLAHAIVESIRLLHPDVRVLDRGGYLRVMASVRCTLSRTALEKVLGRPVPRLASELESVMSSFRGHFCITDEEAMWEIA